MNSCSRLLDAACPLLQVFAARFCVSHTPAWSVVAETPSVKPIPEPSVRSWNSTDLSRSGGRGPRRTSGNIIRYQYLQ